ncbi:phosphotransferase family protein [Frondihabitans cladoniiphilus]|uniref:Aminoglycoside phosphotransferase domain-containing protein n=1 Tax=Frondihabitans cladoniiphilus TaxID=715785 RepID=A0ABP8VRG9_9MICO
MWPNSAAILPAAFDGTGVDVVSFRQHSVEPSGGGYLYGYEVDTRDEAGVVATVLTFVDTDPASVERSSRTVVDPASGDRVVVWAYPADPALPALQTVTYPESVTSILARLGLPGGSASGPVSPTAPPVLSVAAYRPGKRAVVRADVGGTTVFLKVVRPARAEPIAAQHRAFAERGLPVPPVLAVQPDGLLVLACASGVPAGTRVTEIAEGTGFVDNLVTLAQAIAGVELPQRAQSDALDNGDWHRRSLAESLPDAQDRIDRVYDEIDRRRATWSPDELQVVHGDLHLEQLFVDPEDPGRITGMLDIDTAGLGHPARDAGALIAHLVVTAQWHRGNGDLAAARACERIADDVVVAWTTRNPAIADRLAPTIASQLLAHAGGQATLGTEIGRTKAEQLIEAAEGTLWPRRFEPAAAERPLSDRDPASAPTVTFTPPV